ncbi:MAG: Gfo/Idh/MocA family oxidoreductase [Candidatus Hydrogenedentes bacterium]|nr:Gfo/Idh/MocA family oxidoreductase [Candidatus Hydrogenedentota bacterium]
MSQMHWTRRAFLAATSTSAAVVTLGGRAFGQQVNTARVVPGRLSPNELVNVAAIGAGGKGMSDLMGAKRAGANIVAVADPDWRRAEECFATLPDTKRYKDYRVMLDEMPEIDACTVSTPDHSHAPAAYRAMKLGKHVYVQKPLTHTVAEARLLARTAKEMGVATQMGNQGHCGDGVRDLCELLWAGTIGQVKEVHVWTNRPIWPQGLSKPDKTDEIPAELDWDLWLGPALDRPFVAKHPATNEDCYLPFVWRGWWDFGCGALGDMACHIMDAAHWSMRLYEAKSYAVECVQQEGMTADMAPNKSIIKYTFPARGNMNPVDVYWYDGGLKPQRPADIPEGEKLGDGDNGSLFIGESGYLTTGEYGGNSRILPEARAKDSKKPAPYIPRIPGEDPYSNWIYAVKGGGEAASNFSYSGPFTEIVDFGNVALRAQKKLEFDAEKFEVTNDPSLNKFLTKEYRKGWELPV